MKKLYVGNLSFSVTEENIRFEFSGLGTQTDSITIVRDHETGQPRGFSFVEISDDGAAEKAIAGLNGKELMGRALVVNEARPQRPRRRQSRWLQRWKRRKRPLLVSAVLADASRALSRDVRDRVHLDVFEMHWADIGAASRECDRIRQELHEHLESHSRAARA